MCIRDSSIYNPDLELPYWYGDMKGTADAFIFVHRDAKFVEGKIQPGAIVEVFIARGQRNNREALYNAVCEGEYDDEMQGLRERAVSYTHLTKTRSRNDLRNNSSPCSPFYSPITPQNEKQIEHNIQNDRYP